MQERIVILSAFLSPHRSGAEACTEEVALELAARYDITIVTARLQRSLPRRDSLRKHVPVLRVGFGCKLDKWLFPFLAPIAAMRLQPDIIHAVLESYAGAALMLCRIFTKAKTILTCQSTNTRFLVRTIHRFPHKITVISSVLKKRAERFGRSDAVLIPNGLRLADVPQREKILGRMLFVGRLESMKAVDVLLVALQKLPEHVHLRVVGDGSMRATLQRQAVTLEVADRAEFLGYIPTPDVYEEFARASVFCAPSRSEAFGNVFLEAQAAGCAVVGTNIQGIPDIVEDGVTGLLVPPDDSHALANALASLFDDSSLRKQLAQAGQRHAQKYDWSVIAEKYADVYEKLF